MTATTRDNIHRIAERNRNRTRSLMAHDRRSRDHRGEKPFDVERSSQPFEVVDSSSPPRWTAALRDRSQSRSERLALEDGRVERGESSTTTVASAPASPVDDVLSAATTFDANSDKDKEPDFGEPKSDEEAIRMLQDPQSRGGAREPSDAAPMSAPDGVARMPAATNAEICNARYPAGRRGERERPPTCRSWRQSRGSESTRKSTSVFQI